MCRGMQDLYDMVQSQTFVHQLGYGIMRIVLVNLIPELRPLFHSIERGPADGSGSRPGVLVLSLCTSILQYHDSGNQKLCYVCLS